MSPLFAGSEERSRSSSTGAVGAAALSAQVDDVVAALRARSSITPRVGVVLGSGLGAFADTLGGLVKIPFSEIPHMPISRVIGHAGNMCFGDVGGVPVVCMQGRVHYYEGHSIASCVLGVRAMARLGVTSVLITNAAGGLDPTWTAGDLMLIDDHLNLAGVNPLLGENDAAFGPRFPDMTHAYDPKLREALHAIAREANIPLRAGVYAWLSGPTYETPAEIRMLRLLGAHAVGMSTVPEVIALRHMGVRVGALSCITNLAAGITGQKLDHTEVEEMARARRPELLRLLGDWIAHAGAS